MKKMLFVVSQPPYVNTHNAELLEAAMVGAVFEGEVTGPSRAKVEITTIRELAQNR